MELLAVFLPLAAAIIAGFGGRIVGDRGAQLITCSALVVAAVCSVIMFYTFPDDGMRVVHVLNWIQSGDLDVSWALRIDRLSLVMMFVVNLVSACVHIYSIGYMSHDNSKARFMAYLSLFTFMMLMLVTANNMLQLFFGWEGVGLASYLLIGFWFERSSANAAAIKAFVVNRIGDFGLLLGMLTLFMMVGSLQFDTIFDKAAELKDVSFIFMGHEVHGLTLACLLLFMGAMGKSAQLGLHTWLPDAMEGPTPVSALIHAATMVTAGVFLIARMSPVFEYAPGALMVVAVVGALTAFVAATIGLTQFDIKRVIAYSTMSQLGYMFFALGVSAYGAAIFHLLTHAFFKALLFLGAGSVIHAMSDEQDMRKMGGIWRDIKWTYVLMIVGSVALAGLPPLAGYYSKDIILESAFADHTWFGALAFWLGIAAALMTAFYSFRLIFMTFHGKPRADEQVMAHIHESPDVMLAPLIFLAFGAVGTGFIFHELFVGEMRAEFWDGAIFVLPENDVLNAAHHVPEWVPILPTIMGVVGIFLAWVFYIRKTNLPGAFVKAFKPVHNLLFHKWYFDELYDAVFVKNSFRLGNLFWKRGDKAIIDGCGPDGVSNLTRGIAGFMSRLQTGYLYHYAFAMLIGIVLYVTWHIFSSATL